MPLASIGADAAQLAEIGALLVVLGLIARGADRLGTSPIPAYLFVGLVLGQISAGPISFSGDVVEIGADIGLALLLFMLGLEFTAGELATGIRTTLRPGLADVALNFTPGAAIGLAAGWGFTSALLLGGVTYISSSGVVAKVLDDLERLGNRETPAVLSLLVLEDLTMTFYLPLVTVILGSTAFLAGLGLIAIPLTAVAVAILLALRHGHRISAVIHSQSSEVLLLTILGVVMLSAAFAEEIQLSAPVGAFLAGLIVSGPLREDTRVLLAPLRDLFAAVFFIFFAVEIDIGEIPPVLWLAVLLAVVTTATKMVTGWYAARAIGASTAGRVRAGTVLIARGEFSIVIAGLAVGTSVDPGLAPVTAAYVLITSLLGPVLTRWSRPLSGLVQRRRAGVAAPGGGPVPGG
jgi:CPA2 family monovalent cation:H+ antiporter-2